MPLLHQDPTSLTWQVHGHLPFLLYCCSIVGYTLGYIFCSASNKTILLRRRSWHCLIVIVWQPLEHILAYISKTVGNREKSFGVNMSGAVRITHRWHSHGTVVNNKASRSASVYVPERPTKTFLHSHNSKKRWPILVIQTLLESPWYTLCSCFVKKFGDDWEVSGDPAAKVFVIVHYWRALIYHWIGLASVCCLLIHKECNEWPSQAHANFCNNESTHQLLGWRHFAICPGTLNEAFASGAVFVIVSGSDGWTDGNAFGAS